MDAANSPHLPAWIFANTPRRPYSPRGSLDVERFADDLLSVLDAELLDDAPMSVDEILDLLSRSSP